MRLAPFMIVLLVIDILLGLFNATLDPTLTGYQQYSTGSTYLDLALQPWKWTNNLWLTVLIDAAVVVVGILTAQVLFGRSDILTLAGLAAIFLMMGAMPIVDLYKFTTRNIGQFTNCIPGDPCTPAVIFGVLIAGVMAVMWTMTVIEWWFWRPTTQ